MSDSQMPDAYDRLLGALHGLPDEIHTIFLEVAAREGVTRLAIPAAVADCIARQRDALTAKSRSKAAKAAAQEKKDRGIIPFSKKAEA